MFLEHVVGGEHCLNISGPWLYWFGIYDVLKIGRKSNSLTELMSDKFVCRTAPATLGLLSIRRYKPSDAISQCCALVFPPPIAFQQWPKCGRLHCTGVGRPSHAVDQWISGPMHIVDQWTSACSGPVDQGTNACSGPVHVVDQWTSSCSGPMHAVD